MQNTFEFTKSQFKSREIENVEFINDNFDSVFDKGLLKNQKFDLCFIDGNHNSVSLLKYLKYLETNLMAEKCIFIIDDINWSLDMYRGWKQIVKTHADCLSLNLFKLGVVFKNFDYPSGYFSINFVNNR